MKARVSRAFFFFGAEMLKELIEHFEAVVELPIEVEEIALKINDMDLQDEIYFFPADIDPTEIRGAFRQFRTPTGVYGVSKWVTHIAYSQHLDVEWQRVICAKELVHIFDPGVAKTNTEEEVSQLLDKLVGPLSSEDYGFADLQAAKDRLALYQCLPLLLPKAYLEIARNAVDAELKTPEDIAQEAVIPLRFVKLMLSDDWETLNGALIDL